MSAAATAAAQCVPINQKNDLPEMRSGIFFTRFDCGNATMIDLPERLVWPAVRVSPNFTDPSPRASHFGGWPALPPGFEWPTFRNKPLMFLLQIELSELNGYETGLDLPTTGRLLFFYDAETQPWGFYREDAGSAKVVYIPDGEPLAEVSPHGIDPFPNISAAFAQEKTVPDPWSVWVDDLEPTSAERFELDDALEERLMSCTQIGGHPYVVQNSMEDECEEFASKSISDAEEFKSKSKEEKSVIMKKWRLLLQLSSNEETEMMWGDLGYIYFWINEDDLRRRDFSNVWLILQCS